ncbi:MAG: hypothetical protein A2287_01950 [Candidatus Melainabacteria bacterium RIFOXYA12_FULL_32_12]|nr:MAG: hypothetical protein A2287_01950 [Candidatus Melainabacteria bacterium RIFOXYA12_FULL_32_12]
MSRRLLTGVLLVGLFLVVNLACIAKELDNSIKVFHLKNGHTVVIKEVHANPIVTIDTWIKTGSINENDKINGVSHFLEHLLFKGTKNYKAGEMEQILESKGANFNAATSKDFTHYYTTIASQQADIALDLHADLLLNATIPQDELDRERNVVQEEIRRALDNPSRILFNNLNGILFKSHPYKYETLGTMEIIQNLPREEILDYYNKWYTPSNMTTVIVGDIDTDKTLMSVKEKFKDNSISSKTIKSNYDKELYITKNTEKIEKGNYNVGYLEIGFKGVPIWNRKDNYALDLAAEILGSGRSSRLYQNVKEKNLVSSISSGHHSMKDDSIFFIDADLKPENYVLTKKAVLKELDKLRNEKVTKEELEKAKTRLQREFLYGNESVENIANSIGYSMTIGGKLDYYTEYINDINKITADDIQYAVKKYLPESRMATSALLPNDININYTQKPQESYKNASKYILDNNMTLITEKNDSNEIISLSIFVKGGDLLVAQPGLQDILAATLMKGTKSRNALEISKELENSGIIIAPSSEADYFEIKLKSTASDFNKALEILADIINNPVFNPEYIEKAKIDTVQGIKESRDTPLSYAFENFTKKMYPNHPYGYVGEVIEKNINKVNREDLVKFHDEYFIPENMVISVSGNIDTNDLISKLQTYFPKQEGKKININELKTSYKAKEQNQLSIIKKDTTAASMVLGWPVTGITQDKEYASLKIINGLLGNGLSSRLFVNLREKQGLAYVVSSAYPSRLDNSFFVLYIGTKPENIKAVKEGFLNEIKRIKTEPISKKELDEVKQKLIGQFALSQETNQEKAHNLGWFEVTGKGFKYNYEFPDLINSITAEDITNTANKYFNDPYIISIVAPAKNVEGLEKEYNSESKR